MGTRHARGAVMSRATQLTGVRLSTFAVAFVILVPAVCRAEKSWKLSSPSSRLEVKVQQNDGIWYTVQLRGKEVVAPSKIDLKVADQGWLGNQAGEPSATQKSEAETVDF